MKRQHLLTTFLTIFFILFAFHGVDVYAQTSVSGDSACGAWDGKGIKDRCGIDDLKEIIGKLMAAVISIGLPLLVVFIVYRFVIAWFALQQGNANAYKEATEKAGQAVLGFIIVTAMFGGIFVLMLEYLGVNGKLLILLKSITFSYFSHAYAAPPLLPNPLGVTDIYGFILAAVALFMRFFVYPALIAVWVLSGFSYVMAQGAPEKLAKTHKLLFMAVITTVVVFVTQGFLFALRGSVEKILPGSTKSVSSSQGSSEKESYSAGDNVLSPSGEILGKMNSAGQVVDSLGKVIGKINSAGKMVDNSGKTVDTEQTSISDGSSSMIGASGACTGLRVGDPCTDGKDEGFCKVFEFDNGTEDLGCKMPLNEGSGGDPSEDSSNGEAQPTDDSWPDSVLNADYSKSNGEECSSDSQCSSQFCGVDGVCEVNDNTWDQEEVIPVDESLNDTCYKDSDGAFVCKCSNEGEPCKTGYDDNGTCQNSVCVLE